MPPRTLRSRLLLSYVAVILAGLLIVALALFGFAGVSDARLLPSLERLSAISRTNQRELLDLWQAGATNTIDFRINRRLILCVVNQYSTHKSISLALGDVEFDPQINQQILKNGLRIVSPLAKRLVGDFFVVDTRLLKEAAVDQFYTLGASLSFKAFESSNISLGANYDTGDDYKAWSVGLSSAWRW